MTATVRGIHLGIDTHANRPAGNAVPDGSIYSCSTHSLIYVSNYAGNSWATWATLGGTAVDDATISTTDITTNNVSITKHGWAPKAPNDATKYLDGTGAYSVPAGGGGSGALVFLEAHTASSSAQLDFTTFLSSTYDEYLFEGVDIVPATNGVNLNALIGTGGGPTYDTAANYYIAAGNVNSLRLATTISNAAQYGQASFTARLYNPQSAAQMKHFLGLSTWHDGANIQASAFGQLWAVITAVTAVRFLMSTGNIASGVIRCYGVAKS